MHSMVVCMDKHLGTSLITSLQPSKSILDIGYVPPTNIGSLCLAVDSTRTAVPGLFRSLVRWSETRCQMNSEIWQVIFTASNSSLKQSCSVFTSATNALEAFWTLCAISIYFLHTYFTAALWNATDISLTVQHSSHVALNPGPAN